MTVLAFSPKSVTRNGPHYTYSYLLPSGRGLGHFDWIE